MDRDPFIDNDVDNRSASVIQIENGKQTNTIVICAVLCAICASFAFYAYGQAKIAEREARMMTYYINRLDSLLVQNEIVRAGDNYQKFKQEQKE